MAINFHVALNNNNSSMLASIDWTDGVIAVFGGAKIFQSKQNGGEFVSIGMRSFINKDKETFERDLIVDSRGILNKIKAWSLDAYHANEPSKVERMEVSNLKFKDLKIEICGDPAQATSKGLFFSIVSENGVEYTGFRASVSDRGAFRISMPEREYMKDDKKQTMSMIGFTSYLARGLVEQEIYNMFHRAIEAAAVQYDENGEVRQAPRQSAPRTSGSQSSPRTGGVTVNLDGDIPSTVGQIRE